MPMLMRRRPISFTSASTRKLPEYTKEKPRTSPAVSHVGPIVTAAVQKDTMRIG
jgi:hypothetical protein